MPPEKRTKTGKARGGRKQSRQTDAAPAPSKRPPTSLFIAWALAVTFLVALIHFAGQSRRLPEPPAAPPAPKITKPDDSVPLPQRQDLPAMASASKVPPAPRPGGVPFPATSHRPAKASIVIDDLGPDLEMAKQFASLPYPVTLSVLPYQAHSREIAEMAHLEGREVILHLPMEPLSASENPGRGALLVSMSGDEIRRNIKAALDTSPYFDGVNNHMGSRMTQDERIMNTILSELKARDLFFIDSMTTNKSKGWKVAQELKVPNLKRDIFLDDDQSADAIRSQITRLVKIAGVRGTALAIGHPHKTTLRSLQEAAALFRQEGIDMVAARDLNK